MIVKFLFWSFWPDSKHNWSHKQEEEKEKIVNLRIRKNSRNTEEFMRNLAPWDFQRCPCMRIFGRPQPNSTTSFRLILSSQHHMLCVAHSWPQRRTDPPCPSASFQTPVRSFAWNKGAYQKEPLHPFRKASFLSNLFAWLLLFPVALGSSASVLLEGWQRKNYGGSFIVSSAQSPISTLVS